MSYERLLLIQAQGIGDARQFTRILARIRRDFDIGQETVSYSVPRFLSSMAC